ncbi:MAG TPA: hypothetical protein VHU77_07130 [Candidatus Limnocylindria bacterium]|nr:hypothetical protein [Candidatus Limnocylindria bacterium]
MTEAAEDATPAAAPSPDRQGRSGGRRRLGGLLALGWVGLLLLIAAAILVGPASSGSALAVANPDRSAADGVTATLGNLPQSSLVLVAMDADLGTYPEIRPATHAVMADLLSRGATLGFVSVSVEGRALAVAELDRLRSAGVSADRLLDLGFVSGAEAGMVRLVDAALRPGMSSPMAALIAQRGGGIGAFDCIVVVGGGDIGPRSWVEQVGTRLPAVPMVAIAPTFAQPELAPYLRSGQLSGLLATTRDDAAYVDRTRPAAPADRSPSALAMLAGMMIALLVLGRQLLAAVPRLASGAPAVAEPEE